MNDVVRRLFCLVGRLLAVRPPPSHWMAATGNSNQPASSIIRTKSFCSSPFHQVMAEWEYGCFCFTIKHGVRSFVPREATTSSCLWVAGGRTNRRPTDNDNDCARSFHSSSPLHFTCRRSLSVVCLARTQEEDIVKEVYSRTTKAQL